jgi:acyl-CoA thioesterase FadM
MDICTVGLPTFMTRVEAWECDHNQHWNVRHYLRCFQQAGFVATDMCECPQRSDSVYTQHTRFHRELLETAPVEIRSAELADGMFAGATVHIMSSNGRLAATALEHPGHAGGCLPTVASGAVKLALPRGIEGGPHEADPSAFPETAKIIEHGLVQTRELDHTGTIGFDWLMGRIAAASNDLFASLGFTPEFVRDSKISRMGVESKISRLAAIPLGTRLRSIVEISSVGRKNVVLHHRFVTSTGEPVAAVDQSLVTVDMKTRRATELPDFLRKAAGDTI